MTRYMLDTNVISDLIKNPQGKAAKRIASVGTRPSMKAEMTEFWDS